MRHNFNIVLITTDRSSSLLIFASEIEGEPQSQVELGGWDEIEGSLLKRVLAQK